MNRVAYYHIYLPDDSGIWTSMVLEQFKIMEDSHLLDNLDELRVTLISKNDSRVWNFMELIKLYHKNVVFDLALNPFDNDQSMMSGLNTNAVTENYTLRKIYNNAINEDAYVLYFHAKGITALLKHQNEMAAYRQYAYWRYFLNWGVLEKWKHCIEMLDSHDVSGVNYFDYPSPHYSGNFWWTTTNHLRQLPDPSTTDWWYKLQSNVSDPWMRNAPIRFADEHWLFAKPNTKAYNINTNFNHNPANEYTPRRKYDET
jgi:hypothetical protein